MLVYKIIIAEKYIYVGATTQTLKRRMSQHFNNTKKEQYKNVLINKKIIEYGIENVDYIILEDGINDKDMLYKREKYWIEICNSFHDSNEYGLNMTKGGKGGPGGLYYYGELSPCTNLDNEMVYNIKKDFANNFSREYLKCKYSLDSSTLSSIITQASWSKIGKEFNDSINKILLLEKTDLNNKKEELKVLYINGYSIKELSEIYNFTRDTVRKIVKGLVRKNKKVSKRKRTINKDTKTIELVTNIKKDFSLGLSNRNIADKYDLSMPYVCKITSLVRHDDISEELNSKLIEIRNLEKNSKNELIVNIKYDFLNGKNYLDLAKKYGKSISFVRDILNMVRFTDVGEEYNDKIIELKNLEEVNKNELVLEIKKSYIDGLKISEISKKYGVTEGFIENIIYFKRYVDIGKELNEIILENKSLKNELIIKIKNDYVNGMKMNEIIKAYNVGIGFVSGILYLKTHVDVGKEFNEKILAVRNK